MRCFRPHFAAMFILLCIGGHTQGFQRKFLGVVVLGGVSGLH